MERLQHWLEIARDFVQDEHPVDFIFLVVLICIAVPMLLISLVAIIIIGIYYLKWFMLVPLLLLSLLIYLRFSKGPQ